MSPGIPLTILASKQIKAGMVMAYLLLILMAAIEIGFLIFNQIKKSSKKTWSLRRLIANLGQAVLFALMLLLPGIDTSFRFTGLIILLVIRIVFAGVSVLINKNKPVAKKLSGKIASLILSILLITGAMLPSFIFTDYEGLPVHGPYGVKQSSAILVDKNRIEEFESDGSYREVPVYFFYPENASEGDRFPLVVFSHGAFGYYESNASTYLELASQGYVVVSLDHPYHSFFTKDTSGKTVTVDPDFMNSVMNANGDMTEEKIYEESSKWMKLRVGDMNFVLDELKKGADENDIEAYWFENESLKKDSLEALGLIDTDKIGVMGHSMGGATAVEIGKERDDIDAVIDLDGTMLGSIIGAENGKYIVEDVEYHVPLFEFKNAESHYEMIELEKMDYPYPNFVIRDNADVIYCTYFEGSLHMDYTDLPLFSPFLGKLLGSGEVDNAYMMDQVNSLAVEFFDCYLKGEGQFSVSESYPGVR